MLQRRIYVCVTVYLLLAAATLLTVSGQGGRGNSASGQPQSISDWALAGVIWSDLSLLNQAASTAASQLGEESEQRQQLQRLADEADVILTRLEEFGWKEMPRGRQPVRAAARQPGLGIQRYDTETPVGTDDPGLDDERVPQWVDLDIDQYRVDDYIDETPREAANLADAREDGVEGAIAAAAGRPGVQGPVAGRISEREVETRSSRVPYGDSLYDRDHFDPSVDYIIRDPFGKLTGPVVRPENDEINPRAPPRWVDGEDEFIASQAARNRLPPNWTPRYRPPRVPRQSRTQLRQAHVRDADWVQFRRDANQAYWLEIAEDEGMADHVDAIMDKLRATARTSWHATESSWLRTLLSRIAALE